MPYMPSAPPASSNDAIYYPVDQLRAVAARIVADVSIALYEHEANYQQAQRYVQTLPGLVQGAFMDMLKKHDQRLRDSYQWQLDFASAIFQSIADIEGTDTSMQQSFDGFERGHHML